MVRAPCCEKMGLKKGPWTPEEDQILINYINLYGHGNWRALPKQAGLMRCGKSCRLRWTNYLRPDIKRGNFTREEEDTIITLHQLLGNRWSTIAAKLPGRTDNEIKNVWHTHLKKRITATPAAASTSPENNSSSSGGAATKKRRGSSTCSSTSTTTTNNVDKNMVIIKKERQEPVNHQSSSPQRCASSSDVSSVVTNDNFESSVRVKEEAAATEDDFWSEVLSEDNTNIISDDHIVLPSRHHHQLPSTTSFSIGLMEHVGDVPAMPENMDQFWFDVFTGAGELTELPEF